MEFNFGFYSPEQEEHPTNPLIQYLQKQPPETLAWIAQSASPEIKDIIYQNVQNIVGTLPTEDFRVQITADREDLANLLASAMMTGYFLSKMEQRQNLESSFLGADSL